MEGNAGARDALTGALQMQVLLGALYSLSGAMEAHPGGRKALSGALDGGSIWSITCSHWKEM
jgi:hypothetical protein